MYGSQTIEHPFGLSVYGSSIIRVEPDIASLRFSASLLQDKPKDAFSGVQLAVKSITDYLADENYDDFGSSRIALESTTEYIDGKSKFVGYTAKAEFHLILRDLERLESLLVGVVEAGANEIESVSYETSQLKLLRAEARMDAVAAALEKAKVYCEAANVKLGSVIHITDINPESLSERSTHGARFREFQIDNEENTEAFNPGAIAVGGAVLMAFRIV